MEFKEFEELIKKNVNYDVERTTVNKNGIEYDALVINSNDTVKPVIRFDESFTEADIPAICAKLEERIDGAPLPSEVKTMSSWNYAKDNLRMCIRKKTDDDDIVKKNIS